MDHLLESRYAAQFASLTALLLLAGCSVMNDFSAFGFRGEVDTSAVSADAGHDAQAGGFDGDEIEPDAGEPDAGPTTGCEDNGGCEEPFTCVDHSCVFVPPRRTPTGVFASNGGGTASNASYSLRASFGTPQPIGKAKNQKYQLVAGPGAGRP